MCSDKASYLESYLRVRDHWILTWFIFPVTTSFSLFCSLTSDVVFLHENSVGKIVFPGVSPTLCCFVVYSKRWFVLCLTLCYFVLVCFSPFSIAITLLGEERANLSAFRTFVRFALVWFCLFSLPLGSGKGCGLWLWHSLDFFLTFLFCL